MPISQVYYIYIYIYIKYISTDTALYCLFSTLKRTLNHKETDLVLFLNIEGAFDRVPIAMILRALRRKNIDRNIYYHNMG